jgi:hypothetical protein
MDRVLSRNQSVLTDAKRVEQSPMMSMQARPSVDGSRFYVGKSQEVTVSIVAANTATAVAVLLDHVPSDASPRSGIKATTAHTGASIEEFHDATHVWTRTQVWFISNVAGVSQKWLII